MQPKTLQLHFSLLLFHIASQKTSSILFDWIITKLKSTNLQVTECRLSMLVETNNLAPLEELSTLPDHSNLFWQ